MSCYHKALNLLSQRTLTATGPDGIYWPPAGPNDVVKLNEDIPIVIRIGAVSH